MPSSVRFATPAIFCLLSVACHATKPSAAEAPAAQASAPKVDYHLAARVESAAAPAACGGGEHAGCCQGDGACGASCGQQEGASCGGNMEQAQAADQDIGALTRVDPSQVCMVRNHFMGRPQLAVQAEGGTYYGCCPGCANRLFQDAQARKAIDPVSHNAVDKGLAVLGKTAQGKVLYFENEANFESFRRTLTQ